MNMEAKILSQAPQLMGSHSPFGRRFITTYLWEKGAHRDLAIHHAVSLEARVVPHSQVNQRDRTNP